MAPSSVLVVGATGKQGGAVLKALLSYPSPPKILALTRNKSSPAAEALLARNEGKVWLVEGDTTKPAPIFASQPEGSVDAVFLVTTPPKEEAQAIAFIDAAAAHGVSHLVFASVDRGGEPKSWDNPTDIPHFIEKHTIELHLRDKVPAQEGGKTMRWTILRPTAFMDNMNPGMLGSMFVSMWAAGLKPETKLQLVATRDVGVWAARALMRPDEYAGKAISLAGDEVTLDEAKATFKRVVGTELPQAWQVFGKGLMWAVGEVGRMFAFFQREGYAADIAALRKEEESMQDLETWLRTESGWKDKVVQS